MQTRLETAEARVVAAKRALSEAEAERAEIAAEAAGLHASHMRSLTSALSDSYEYFHQLLDVLATNMVRAGGDIISTLLI